MPHRISTVRGRELGEGVRAAVQRADLSGRELAGLVGWDPAKVSDLLNGKGGTTEIELAVLLGACKTPVAEREHLLNLYRESTARGWLQQHGGKWTVQPVLRTLVENEKAATEMISWQMNLVHGLLQTQDYMRAVITASATVPKAEVEERVAARLKRQTVLGRQCQFALYVHEQALRLPVGGSDAMAEQLYFLLTMSVRPYISLRIVPEDVGAHAGLAASFTLLKFHRFEPVVSVENETTSLFVEDTDSITSYEKVLKSIGRVALGEEQSRQLITEIVTGGSQGWTGIAL